MFKTHTQRRISDTASYPVILVIKLSFWAEIDSEDDDRENTQWITSSLQYQYVILLGAWNW